MDSSLARNLAAKHGLNLTREITFNEMGLDFQVAIAKDKAGTQWVLRIPRRPEMLPQIEREARFLELMRAKLPIAVPDWNIKSGDLVAYPLLPGKPTVSFDHTTHEITWSISPDSKKFLQDLARTLVCLHQIPHAEARLFGIKTLDHTEERRQLVSELDRVRRELGLRADLEDRLRSWISKTDLWPDFSTVVHGDLYAGHILVDSDGHITGVIDWSEVEIRDPSVDFSGHLAVFGEDSLHKLIEEYKNAGGQTWPQLFEQAVERHAASALKFATFALNSKDPSLIEAAKAQLHTNT